MSNPTTGVWNLSLDLSGSPTSLTGVDPIRFDDGLWLEQATTNLCTNPIAGSGGTTGYGSTRATLSQPDATRIRVTRNDATPATDFRLTTASGNIPAVSPGDVVVVSFELVDSSDGQALGLAFQWHPSVNGGGGAITTSFVNSLSVAADGRYYGVSPAAPALAASTFIRVQTTGTGVINEWFEVRNMQYEIATYPTSFCPLIVATAIQDGYAWTGTAHASTSTRAASSASVTIAEPAAVACWYREGYSGPKTFAYIEPYGTLGTYGSIAWSGGTLTLSTSRNLVIGPFAAFSRALTATEQANLKSTQNWTMNSVNGSNIILPLSGRRRPR